MSIPERSDVLKKRYFDRRERTYPQVSEVEVNEIECMTRKII